MRQRVVIQWTLVRAGASANGRCETAVWLQGWAQGVGSSSTNAEVPLISQYRLDRYTKASESAAHVPQRPYKTAYDQAGAEC